MKKLVLHIVLLGMFCCSYAQEKRVKDYLPHTYKLQYAGNMGFLSVGAGYLFHKRKMSLGLQVGYLPKSIGNTEIWTTTLKYTWSPFSSIEKTKWRLVPFTVGMNVIASLNDNIERRWGNHYPKGYYNWIPAMNYALFFGSSFYFKTKTATQIGFFYEVAWVSRLLELWYSNTNTIHFTEIWNLSLGVDVLIR